MPARSAWSSPTSRPTTASTSPSSSSLPRALPNEDAEVSKEIEKQYKKLGVKILTGTKVESITDDGSQVTVVVSKDGVSQELKADKVMQAIGFAPNITGYGLETTGVALTDRGAIAIDDYMRTNVPHIYAIGDVTAKLQLATWPRRWRSSRPRRSAVRRR